MKAATTQSYTPTSNQHDTVRWLDNCQIIIDPTGSIIHCQSHSMDPFDFPNNHIEGQILQEMLVEIHPAWKQHLPTDLFATLDPIFLPWTTDTDAIAAGIVLSRTKFQGNLYVTLSPGLAPHRDMLEAPCHTLQPDSSALAQVIHRMQLAESRLNNYMCNFPGVFFSQRADYSFHFIGAGFNELTQHDPHTFTNNSSAFINMLLKQDRDYFIKELNKANGSKDRISISYRIRNQHNEIRYILDVRTPKYSPSGLFLGYEGVWLDVTRQSIAENHLSNTAWKESLATLTGGLIHDFSNIMAGIFSLSELYCDGMEDNHPMHSGLKQIKKNSEQAQHLVRRIIDLNRESAPERNYHNLEYLIQDQLDLFPIILPRCCQLETSFTDTEIPVYIDNIAFRQLLLNMAMNTRDALHNEHGKVKISVHKIPAGKPALVGAINGPIHCDTDGVEIQFSDNGCGIPSAYLERIFDPFFTTKELSKGSGFGLYNAKLFVEENQGHMGVRSACNQGATFYIYFPIADLSMPEDNFSPAHIDQENSFTRRPNTILYGAENPENYEIVNILRNREWEVITFDRLDKLAAYLQDTSLKPDALIAVKIGHDPEVESLIDAMISQHPEIQRFMQVRGVNPDQIPSSLRDKVSRVFDESMQDKEIVHFLADCIT